MFADAARKHQHVKSAQGGGELAQFPANAVNKQLPGEFRLRIAGARQGAHVAGQSRHTKQPGLLCNVAQAAMHYPVADNGQPMLPEMFAQKTGQVADGTIVAQRQPISPLIFTDYCICHILGLEPGRSVQPFALATEK